LTSSSSSRFSFQEQRISIPKKKQANHP
jgi:hypothetical protein